MRGGGIVIGTFPRGGQLQGFSGTLAADGAGTLSPLSGQNFGSATITCHVYDDFRGQSDAATPSTTAVHGTWSSVNSSNGEIDTAQSIANGRSTLCSNNVFGAVVGATTGMRVSFHVRNNQADADIPAGSFKTTWLMDGANGYQGNNDFDYCTPTKMNLVSTGWGVAGNDGNLVTGIGEWMPAGEWVYAHFGFDATDGWFMVRTGATYGYQENSGSANLLDNFSASTTMDRVNLPGYVAGGNAPWYDMLMVHYGAGACARVEVGDAEAYSSCTALYDCQIDSWTSTAITMTFRLPDGFSLSGKYLHVHLADRSHENGGTGRAIS